jgi:hypothetical protein
MRSILARCFNCVTPNKYRFQGGGEAVTHLAALTACERYVPTTRGQREGRTVSCGTTTYHEDRPALPVRAVLIRG